jgi:hypothetical protein
MMHRSSLYIAALAVSLIWLPVNGVVVGQSQKKPVVGIVSATPARSMWSLDELCKKASIVVEVVPVRRGVARELKPSAPDASKEAVTPITVKVLEVYKDTGVLVVAPGTELSVLEHYGTVETATYIVRSSGESRFKSNGRHVAFLECGVEGECRMAGPTLRLAGDEITSDGVTADSIEGGTSKVRERLRACGRGSR